MNIYEPIHAYDLTVLVASRDVLTRVKGADDILTASAEQYSWTGIGRPIRDPDAKTEIWVCHVACCWMSFNTIPVIGRDAYDALKSAFELVESAVKMHRKLGHQIFFRDYGMRGPEWIPDDAPVRSAVLDMLVAAACLAGGRELHAKITEMTQKTETERT